jgi:hypothetical protein
LGERILSFTKKYVSSRKFFVKTVQQVREISLYSSESFFSKIRNEFWGRGQGAVGRNGPNNVCTYE